MRIALILLVLVACGGGHAPAYLKTARVPGTSSWKLDPDDPRVTVAPASSSRGIDAPAPAPAQIPSYIERELDRRWGELVRSRRFFRGAWSFGARAGDLIYGEDWAFLLDTRTNQHCGTDHLYGRRRLVCTASGAAGEPEVSLPVTELQVLGRGRTQLRLTLVSGPIHEASDATTPRLPLEIDVRPTRPTLREALWIWSIQRGHDRQPADPAGFSGQVYSYRSSVDDWRLAWEVARPRWVGDAWHAEITGALELGRTQPPREVVRTTFRSTLHIDATTKVTVGDVHVQLVERLTCREVNPGTRTAHEECGPRP